MKVTATSGLTKDEVERLVGEADKYRQADELRRYLAELRNQAETLVYTTEQALDGYADLLEAALLGDVREDCDTLRKLLESGGDLIALREAYARLEGAAFRIAESIYGEPEPAGDGAVG